MKTLITKNRQQRLAFDLILLCGSYYLAMLMSHKPMDNNQILIPIILVFIWYFTSKYTNLYDDFRTTTFVEELLVMVPNVLFQLIAVGFIYFTINDHIYVLNFSSVLCFVLDTYLGIQEIFFEAMEAL